jgi:tripartite motif-containing protein 71
MRQISILAITATVMVLAAGACAMAPVSSAPISAMEMAPTPLFMAHPFAGNAPLHVGFSDRSANFPTAWYWDFGDGYTSTEQNPVHIYRVQGMYTVSLTVSNVAGSNTASYQDYITVRPPHRPLPTPKPPAGPVTPPLP